jgi:hypothetical protein
MNSAIPLTNASEFDNKACIIEDPVPPDAPTTATLIFSLMVGVDSGKQHQAA